ncbi:MAG: hypothetical protein CVU61_02205 [Deltaproteobacteria bacterium HGW-Deltaproteobacteria-19]|nr:MAG: hypothetical protein CVU61_02205 [Deltaproteobacteria bacterium HGW-Deltaproteobacteria-19]
MERKPLISNDQVLITCVSNPFDPLAPGSRDTRVLRPGKTLMEIMGEFQEINEGYEIAVSINGALLEGGPERFDIRPSGGMSVVFAAVPQGGGGNGGKNPLQTILSLVVVIVAAVVTYGVGGYVAGGAWAWGAGAYAGATGWAAVAGYAAGMAVAIAGGLLVTSLFPASAAMDSLTSASSDLSSSSATYGWDVSSNPVEEGGPVPVLYGTHRVVPTLIGKYVELDGDNQYLNLLFAVADHEVTTMSGIRINETPVENYSGISKSQRMGTVDQPVIQFFGDTHADVPVSARLKSASEWITRRTQGNVVQGVGVGILFPNGLCYANDSGGIDAQTVELEVQYRKVGEEAWTALSEYHQVSVEVPAYRWSAGYYDETGTWIEMEEGSSVATDHIECDPYTPDPAVWSYNPNTDTYIKNGSIGADAALGGGGGEVGGGSGSSGGGMSGIGSAGAGECGSTSG